jgi:hypothetical protein
MHIDVWAIRQKSTGYFMPASSKKRGYSRDEPTPDCVPRLFLKYTAARAALRMWLMGTWSTEFHADAFGEAERYYVDATPVEGRNADDMEVVKLLITNTASEPLVVFDGSHGPPVRNAGETD